MCDNDVYYKLYLDRDRKITVVCMQWFDEPDYDPNKFFVRGDGSVITFKTEEEAIAYLNCHFMAHAIDPEYVTPNNPEFLKHAKHGHS